MSEAEAEMILSLKRIVILLEGIAVLMIRQHYENNKLDANLKVEEFLEFVRLSVADHFRQYTEKFREK